VRRPTQGLKPKVGRRSRFDAGRATKSRFDPIARETVKRTAGTIVAVPPKSDAAWDKAWAREPD
jgi:hypothetical protein